MNSRVAEGRTMLLRRRGILIALAIVGLSATLGLSIPRQVFAEEEVRFRCSRESTCVLGNQTNCAVACDDTGCGCDEWGDT
jgi:hypothetical protein